MRFRQLGQTGMKVSVVGFGASALGDVFAVTDPAEGERAVRRAIGLGVNLFDVAPYYGLTLAEQRLGAALAGQRDQVFLATKCGRYGTEEFDFSAAKITAEFHESLRRLRTDHVDLLQVHDIEFGSFDRIVNETLPALARLKEQGKTRAIGITGYSPGMLARVAAAAPVDTVLNYCRYNLMIVDMDKQLTPFANEHALGLINASPLHMGILTGRGGPDWHPAPMAVREAGSKAQEICRAHGASLPEVALRFCLAHPVVASTLVGMATEQEVTQNLRALEPKDDRALIEEIHAAIGPQLDYVWPSGRPENQR